MKNTKCRVQGTTGTGEMTLPYIYVNKGKYPLYGQDPLTFINVSDNSHIS